METSGASPQTEGKAASPGGSAAAGPTPLLDAESAKYIEKIAEYSREPRRSTISLGSSKRSMGKDSLALEISGVIKEQSALSQGAGSSPKGGGGGDGGGGRNADGLNKSFRGVPLRDVPEEVRKSSLISPFHRSSGSRSDSRSENSEEIKKAKAARKSEAMAAATALSKHKKKTKHERGLRMLNSKLVQVPVAIATLVALFAPDAFMAAFDSRSDPVLQWLLFVSLLLFAFELALTFRVKPEYRWTFYFWLDLVSTLSLVADIPFLYDWALPPGSAGGSAGSNLAILRAGRLVRTGTRATRALRMLKFVRFVRIMRLFRFLKIYRGHLEQTMLNKYEQDPESTQAPNRLGVHLADLLGKRVILGTILMLLMVPLLEVQPVDMSGQYGLDTLALLASQREDNVTWYEDMRADTPLGGAVQLFVRQNSDLLLLEIENVTVYSRSLEGIRPALISGLDGSTTQNKSVNALFDDTQPQQAQAALNMLLTFSLTVLLSLSAFLFNRDVHENVVKPIIKTTKVIRKLAKTLFLMTNETDNYGEEEDESALEGTFINNIVDQLVTFFDVDKKPDLATAAKGAANSVSPMSGASQGGASVLEYKRPTGPFKTPEEIPDERVQAVHSFAEFWQDKQALQYFKVFLTSEFAVESMLFVEALENYRVLWQDVNSFHWEIIRKYVHERAAFQVNISDTQRRDLLRFDGKAYHEALYDDARKEISKQLERDNWPRFRKSTLFKDLLVVKKAAIFKEQEEGRARELEEGRLKAEQTATDAPHAVAKGANGMHVMGIVKMVTTKMLHTNNKKEKDSTVSPDGSFSMK